MYIRGQNVLLRAIELEDAEMLRTMINDEEIETMTWGYSFPVSEQQQINWIKNLSNNNSNFRAIIDVHGKAVGTIMLTDIDLKNGNAEIHIKLSSDDVRGKGYGTDAVNALVRYCFNELRMNCIYCRVKESNIASQKMFSKCGFVKEGVLRARVFRNGKYHNFYEYSLLRSEYEDRKCEK